METDDHSEFLNYTVSQKNCASVIT